MGIHRVNNDIIMSVNSWQKVWYNGGDWGQWDWVTWGLVRDMGVEVMGVGVGSGTHFPVEHLGQWGFPEVGVQLELHALLQMGNLNCSRCLIGKWESDPI